MWFRCSGGNGTGGGATITVTYSSQFYNKTMTCTKGTKTYTKTTTSSGSTVFDVDESGTWTITCDGVSRTVDVVLEYSTQMAITKTITVYGAASDTVSFTDATGAKTVTTDASGQGSVSITFIPPSHNITFTSNVAKNPSNMSQAYSKTIAITENTTSIYVMPQSNNIYWYGYNHLDLEILTSGNGWSVIGGAAASFTGSVSYNTNSISWTTGSTTESGVGLKNAVSGITKWNVMCKTKSGQQAVIGYTQPAPYYKDIGGYSSGGALQDGGMTTQNITTSNAINPLVTTWAGSSAEISAMWYE